jgi:hypothetical protein
MPDERVNPYAPPTGDVTAPPEETRLWAVTGGYLTVRNGAYLPPVDLEGDGSEAPLTPVVRQCALSFRRTDSSPAVVKFRGYISVASFDARMKRTRWRHFLTLLGVVALVVGWAGVKRGVELSNDDRIVKKGIGLAAGSAILGGLGLLSVFASGIWERLDIGVRCSGVRDGWFYLRGISPRSLSLLATRTWESPVVKTRQGYRFYSHRLPLGYLLRRHWLNPVALILIPILKARRSPLLESVHLHPSEDDRRPPEEGDTELLEQWRRETAGTEMEGWRAVSARTVGLPAGSMGLESVLYLSPDRTCAAGLLINRISNGKYSSRVRQTILRSWTEDRCILTTTPPSFPLHSPWIDRLKSHGPLPALLKSHRAHIGDRQTITLQSDQELYDLLVREFEEEAAVFREAGWQGPLEDMEVQEYAPRSSPRPPPYPEAANRS